ncbi:anthrone oxygenase family protein [Streptomyces sp. NPDC006458]|uniref:anthrone oxygenase family protein n=1 Tax=Streptomyces sp. NPDC006458 TaxID=3154302 RepID=UPI0033B15714
MTTRSRTAGPILLAATILVGLMAGTFFIFACAVMPALSRSEDRVFVQVMRDINDVIQNPLFLLAFMGALLLSAAAAWQSRAEPHRWWTWSGCAAYALVFLVTVVVNVPLNDQLASATGSATAARADFEDAWVAWNAVRAGLSVAGLGLLAAALTVRGRR